MYTISVRAHGPVFDGRADAAVDDFLDAAEADVAQQGFSEVMERLDRSIRHPTPYYETQLVVERQRGDSVVHDRGVIYGPWLEGVGSRNAPVTRFKGYFSFRRAVQALRPQAVGLAEKTLRRFLPRMQ